MNPRLIVNISAVMLLLSACASYDRNQVNVLPVDEYENRIEIDGISMAAEVYNTTDKSKLAFDEDLTTKGYIPINIVLRNDSDDRVLILKESIELVDESGFVYRPINASLVAEEFEDNKMAYALLGFGIFSYASAEEANEEREADYLAKELSDNMIIGSGRAKNGFTYFQLPKGLSLDGMTLRIDAEYLSSNRVTELALTF